MLGAAIPVLCLGLHGSADKGLPVLQMKGKVAPIEAYLNPQLWQNQYWSAPENQIHLEPQIWALVPRENSDSLTLKLRGLNIDGRAAVALCVSRSYYHVRIFKHKLSTRLQFIFPPPCSPPPPPPSPVPLCCFPEMNGCVWPWQPRPRLWKSHFPRAKYKAPRLTRWK